MPPPSLLQSHSHSPLTAAVVLALVEVLAAVEVVLLLVLVDTLLLLLVDAELMFGAESPTDMLVTVPVVLSTAFW